MKENRTDRELRSRPERSDSSRGVHGLTSTPMGQRLGGKGGGKTGQVQEGRQFDNGVRQGEGGVKPKKGVDREYVSSRRHKGGVRF